MTNLSLKQILEKKKNQIWDMKLNIWIEIVLTHLMVLQLQ